MHTLTSFGGKLFLVQVIDRQQRDNNWSLIRIRIVFRIAAIACHLALLQPLRTVEHNEHDSDVSDDGSDPLADGCIGGKSADEHSGPEQDLTEIVGTAAHLEKPSVATISGRPVSVLTSACRLPTPEGCR